MKKFPATITVLVFGILGVACVQHERVELKKQVEQKNVCRDLSGLFLNRVYDGDTIFVTIPAWHPIVGKEIGIRIAGIDTPEMRTRSGKEKRLAIKARDLVRKRIAAGKKLELRNLQRGKYFRIVADVFIDDIRIADLLLEAGLAVRYDGGKKTKDWSD